MTGEGERAAQDLPDTASIPLRVVGPGDRAAPNPVRQPLAVAAGDRPENSTPSRGPSRGPSRRRALVIHNPTAGYLPGRGLAKVCREMRRLGCQATILRTTARGDAEVFAANAPRHAFDVVVAAGGDGTVNEVVNGLAGTDVPLAVLPCGTANVLAAETTMPRTSRKLASLIVGGPVRQYNLGVANGRRFVMMAGVGFDARVIRAVDPAVKRWLGQGVYMLQFIRGLVHFPETAYQVTIDGRSYRAASVVIANGRYYGGRFSCAVDACLSECCLDVCLFERSDAWNVVRYAAALARGRLHTLPDFRIVRGLEVRIDGPPGDPVQCDGDITGELPLIARAEGPTLPLVVAG